jgi:hypothetical protein
MNPGFDPAIIAEHRARMQGKSYLLIEDDDASEEYQHFYFVGKKDGKEVLVDTVLCTLRLEHERQLFELAEEKAFEQFPTYQQWIESDQPVEDEASRQMEEEVGLFIADVVMELQEEGSIKVQEYTEVVEDAEFGIGLDVALHRDRITPQVIEKFVADYNNEALVLDDTLYSFQTEEEEEM